MLEMPNVGDYDPRETRVTCTGNVDRVVRANPSRVYLGLCAPSLGDANFSTRADMGVGTGIRVGTGFTIMQLYWNYHASLVTAEWYVRAGVGAVISVLEVFAVPGEKS